MSEQDGTIGIRYEYALITRQPQDFQYVGASQLLASLENSRLVAEIHLERIRVTEAEILRRDSKGLCLENEDFNYQILPDVNSITETRVEVTWKPGRSPKVRGDIAKLRGI